MIKNIKLLNKVNKINSKTQLNLILHKKLCNNIFSKLFIKINNIKNSKISKTKINKKCIITNKYKILPKNINISRWNLLKNKLKLNINKW